MFYIPIKLVNFNTFKNTLTLIIIFEKISNYNLNTDYSFKIYNATTELPTSWNDLAVSTIFLSKDYLEVLEKSSPENMICKFIGIFENDILIGIAISQFLNLNMLESYGDRDKCIKTVARNIIFRNISLR